MPGRDPHRGVQLRTRRQRPKNCSGRRRTPKGDELAPSHGVNPEFTYGAARVTAGRSGSRFDIFYFRLSGTTPPLSITLVMTCLCSQMFISAEPSRAPV